MSKLYSSGILLTFSVDLVRYGKMLVLVYCSLLKREVASNKEMIVIIFIKWVVII